MVEWTATVYAYVTSECVVSALILAPNLLVLTSLMRTKHLQTVTNCFIGSLAMADFLVGFSIPTVVIVTFLGYPHNYGGCVLMCCLQVMLGNLSLLTMLMVALERFVYIRFPYFYSKWLTSNSRAATIIGVVWGVSVIVGFTPAMEESSVEFNGTCVFRSVLDIHSTLYKIFAAGVFVPFIVIFSIHVYIILIARKRRAEILRSAMSIESKRCHKKKKRELHGLRTLVLLIISLVLCWGMRLVETIVFFHDPSRPLNYQMTLAVVVLSHLCSAINPYLYALVFQQFRIAIYIMAGKSVAEFSDINSIRSRTSYTRQSRKSCSAMDLKSYNDQWMSHDSNHLPSPSDNQSSHSASVVSFSMRPPLYISNTISVEGSNSIGHFKAPLLPVPSLKIHTEACCNTSKCKTRAKIIGNPSSNELLPAHVDSYTNVGSQTTQQSPPPQTASPPPELTVPQQAPLPHSASPFSLSAPAPSELKSPEVMQAQPESWDPHEATLATTSSPSLLSFIDEDDLAQHTGRSVVKTVKPIKDPTTLAASKPSNPRSKQPASSNMKPAEESKPNNEASGEIQKSEASEQPDTSKIKPDPEPKSKLSSSSSMFVG